MGTQASRLSGGGLGDGGRGRRGEFYGTAVACLPDQASFSVGARARAWRGTSASSPPTTSPALRPSMRASYCRMIRWTRTGAATAATSSKLALILPCIRARAFAAEARARAARGLAPYWIADEAFEPAWVA